MLAFCVHYKRSKENVDEKGDDGITALMWAALSGNTENVEYLISCGYTKIEDSCGGTVLDWAKTGECEDTIKFLILHNEQRKQHHDNINQEFMKCDSKLKLNPYATCVTF